MFSKQMKSILVHALARHLRDERNVAELELDRQRFAVQLFEKTAAQDAVDFHGGAVDLVRAWVVSVDRHAAPNYKMSAHGSRPAFGPESPHGRWHPFSTLRSLRCCFVPVLQELMLSDDDDAAAAEC
jgi:hypothetical protein